MTNGQSPAPTTFARIRRDAILVATGLVLLFIAVASVVVFTTLRPGALGVDLHSYLDAARSWLAGDGYYHARQLAGPYEIVGAESPYGADTLYPPTILWLLVPFTVLPEVLWWAIPAALFGAAMWRLRPSSGARLGILILFAIPWSLSSLVQGNPVIWVASLTALGMAYGWGGAFVLLKPSLFPFALAGITGRRWWYVVAVLAVLTLPLMPLLLEYPSVILNSRGGGLLYSLRDVPLLLAPLVAWFGSATRAPWPVVRLGHAPKPGAGSATLHPPEPGD